MKYRLLKVEGENAQNIGDYIQALAASQFYPTIDGFVNREYTSEYDGEECVVIMNGWFMHNPKNWPPSNLIHPLFVAFHLNNSAKDLMLTKESVEYFREHGPIGCRDTFTRDLLKSKGIDAYFSGCLTLTLGYKYTSKINSRKGIYIVDPIIPNATDLLSLLKDIVLLTVRPKKIFSLSMKLMPSINKLNNILLTARFYRLYKKYFSEEDLLHAEYIQHETPHYLKDFKNEEERFEEAKRLVKLYANAEYVITSRIHCALPCLGLGTPVYFTYWEKDVFISSCRYGGIKELFNGIKCSKKGISPCFNYTGVLSRSNIVSNKEDWRKLSDSLKERCLNFIKKQSGLT